MGKLTVYIPDDLADQVREADIVASQICQQALADAVTGPRVTPGQFGWCRLSLPEAEVAVRFADDNSYMCIAELVVAPHRSAGGALAAVPVGPLLAWARAQGSDLTQPIKAREALDDDERAQADAVWRAEPSLRAGWGISADAVGDLRPA